jgi:hypothetical protein
MHMAKPPLPPLETQVRRAWRRLFLQGLLDHLTTAWIIGLGVAAAYLLVQPYLRATPPPGARWGVFVGVAIAATLGALIVAIVRRPSAVAAALAIDERFGLHERVTTALTLAPQQAVSPAGTALLADLDHRLMPLRIRERFPLHLRRRAVWLPCLGVMVALLAAFWRPGNLPPPKDGQDQKLAASTEAQTEIDKKLKGLEKKNPPKRASDKPKSPDLQRLEAELDKLAHKPHETREQARDVVKDIGNAEDQVKERDKELKERAQAMREQMRQLERLAGQKPKDGPGKKLENALDKADFRKAREEAEKLGRQLEATQQADRLRKKLQEPEKLNEEEKKEAREQLQHLKNQELKDKDREKLGEQMQDMEDRLQRLTRSEEAKERLRELERQGLINKEQLDRELDQLQRNSDKLDPQTKKLLQDIAKKLAEARQCMKEGKDAEAAQKLAEIGEMLGKLDMDGEGKALAQQLQALEEARQALCRALDGKPQVAPGGPGGPAGGRRPESKDGVTGAKEDWAHSDMDKGRLDVIDQVPGDGFKGPRTPADMTDDIRRAAQDAPEAIDRQRLPRSASDMAKGYFDKLRDRK